jgi:hypothetical protein
MLTRARLCAARAPRRRTVALATVAAAFAFAPATALADTSMEVETGPLSPSTAGQVITDAAAGGGKAFKIWSNASVTKSVTTTAGSVAVIARAKGEQCSGAPQMTVDVDGTRRITASVSATSYTDYRTDVALTAGTHTIKVAFTNDYKSSTCDRNLIADSVRLVDAATSTPTTSTPTTSTPTTSTPTTSTPTTPTTTTPTTPAYTKVVNIWMENKGYNSVIGSSAAPYENSLANTYGLATAFGNVTHPSLPNYIAATSGGTQGVTDDNGPSSHQLQAQSIFGQLNAAGKTWKAYQESMTSNCLLSNTGSYVVKHNPAAYYVPLRTSCAQRDVPMGTVTAGNFLNDVTNGLPNFSFVTPNMINDTHDADVATGDRWVQSWIPKIMAGPDYQAGRLIIILSWDETSGTETRQPEIVISPTTKGIKTGVSMNHYSRLAALQSLFGLAPLGNATAARGAAYRSAFHL